MKLPRTPSFAVRCWSINHAQGEGLSLRPSTITVEQGRIARVEFHPSAGSDFPSVIGCPGGVNAHMHPESNTVTLGQSAPYFAAAGETLIVTDFHEAANAGGVDYVLWNMKLGERTPLRYAHGTPSSVPSDPRYEQVGTEPFGVAQLAQLFDSGCTHLAEVMAYGPYINGAEWVHQLVDFAASRGRPADGHAVRLSPEEASVYFKELKISTNHECTELDEARAQQALGVKIWIRRGSAAKDFGALWPLLSEQPGLCGLCTDDLHPDALIAGLGTFSMVREAVLERRVAPSHALEAWSYVPRRHYGVGGLLRPGDPADLVLLQTDSVTAPTFLEVQGSYVGGELIAENGQALFDPVLPKVDGTDSSWRRTKPVSSAEFRLPAKTNRALVLQMTRGSLIKKLVPAELRVEDGCVVADYERDIAKAGSLNRYTADASPSVLLMRGFGVKAPFGMVSSVAHDRHSPLYLGTNDRFITDAMNLVIEAKGGLAVCSPNHRLFLPLPICGLMSDLPVEEVARRYAEMERVLAEELTDGSMGAALMALSFAGLIVIPDGGIGDDGLYRMGADGPEPVGSIFV